MWFNSYAQNDNYIFKHITANDGLLSNKVTCLYQDKEGFIWIGYQTGLQRYDGTKFKTYTADVRDTAALQSDWVAAIFEDSKKRFWIGNDIGTAYLLNRKTGKFYNYNLHASPQNKISGINAFTEDKLGAIWIAAHDGLYKLNEKTNEFEKQDALLGLTKNTRSSAVGSMLFDDENNIWLNTAVGIKFFNQKEKKLYDADYNPEQLSILKIKNLGGVSLLTQKILWFTGNGGVYKYNLLTNELNKFSIDKLPSKKTGPLFQKETVTNLYCVDTDKIIIGLAGRGLGMYNSDKNNFSIVEIDNNNPTGYHALESNESTNSLIQDNDKNIIIGTGTGINIYNKQKQ